MKYSSRILIVGLILLLLTPLMWLAWSNQPNREGGNEPVAEANLDAAQNQLGGEAVAAVTPVPTETPLPPTKKPPATLTPLPTVTSAPTETPTPIPSSTPTWTPSPTATSAVIVDNIDRTCPNPAPLRPNYDRYYVPAQSWPTPIGDTAAHLWLAKPLPGGGRLLYTDWFPYGYDAGNRYLIHNGLDVSEPLGTPALAVASGTVVVAGDDQTRLYGWRCDWYGHLVVIELDQQWLDEPVYILYGHVLEISVEVGQHVNVGDQVAEVGIGGAATLPHLHFEVRVGTNEFGSTRNPLLWLTPPSSRGVLVGRVVDPDGRPWQGVAVNALGQSEETEDYVTWSYLGDPQNLINPDEILAENFVFGDMRPGRYEIYVLLQGTEYRAEVEVRAGEISAVEIVTEPLKTATPEPTPTGAIEGAPDGAPEPGDEATPESATD